MKITIIILFRYLISHIERAYDYYNKGKMHAHSSSLISPSSKSNIHYESPTRCLLQIRHYLADTFHRCVDFAINPLRKCSSDEIYSLHTHSIQSSSEGATTTTTSLEEEPTFYSSVLFRVYLLKKLAYIANTVFQFVVLSKFVAGQTKSNLIYNENVAHAARSDVTYLADNSIMLGLEFGYNAISSLVRTGNLFEESSMLLVFHTVVFCDFQIRMLGDR